MWSSSITFDRPLVLLLLPVCLIAIWSVSKLSLAHLNEISRRQVFIIRLISVTLLVMCISGPIWHKKTDKVTTIFVVDVSDSISMGQRQDTLRFVRSALDHKRSGDKVGLVVFGSEPFVEFPPASSIDLSHFQAQVPGSSTDIEAALQAASGAMPQDSGRRIVLCTDGLENSESAQSEIQALRSEGIQVDVAPTMINQSNNPEALVERVVLPAQSSVNSPVVVRVVVSSNVAQQATLKLTRDGKVISNVSLHLDRGKNAFYFDDRVGVAGLHRYTADLSPTVDTRPENNSQSSLMQVEGVPRVLLVRDSNEPVPSALPAALGSQGLTVDIREPEAVPVSAAGLAGYDSVILSDVESSELTTNQMTALQQANQNFGIGLGMVGGVHSFGVGGYGGTPIESALPVTMTPKDEKRVPSADVVIVLDASGSMSADEDGVEKVEIAARAAMNLLGALKPKDRVAVLAVTETATIVMPLVSPSEAGKYIPDIEAVSAGGGGIDCRNGLEAAYELLQTSDAQIKHVIICPDTTDSEQQEGCVALATAQYNGSKITTSVCGIGQWTDGDVPFQRSLAAAGHGQLYVANRAGNLPTFFQRDVSNVEEKLFVEGLFNVTQQTPDPVVENDPLRPQVLGYDLVTLKPGAVGPLSVSSHTDPLLAYWHRGIGKSFAFTSDDDSHWSKRWVIRSNFATFWAHIVRWSLKGHDDHSFQMLTTDISGKGHIVVDAFNQSGYSTSSNFTTNIAFPDGSLHEQTLKETTPGRYEADFDASGVGGYLVQVRNSATGGFQSDTVTSGYSDEYASLRPNTQLLDGIVSATGGKFLKYPSEAFRSNSSFSLGTESLDGFALFVACLLMLLDVSWRRFGWRLGRQSATALQENVRDSAVLVADRIKNTVNRPKPNSLNWPSDRNVVKKEEVELLRNRTAGRADADEDDPFPFVATLPPKGRQ